MFKRINTNSDSIGTSFHDVTLSISYDDLVKLFGEPEVFDDRKVKHQWIFKSSTGAVITVYDYKFSGRDESFWHVGGCDKISCLAFTKWLATQHKG